MIAVFAGCRYLDVGRWWWPTLDAIREEHGITEVWHGACSLDHQHPDKLAGVDAGIDLWARDRGLAVRMFPAPWALYRRAGLDPKAAGMRRVADMLRGDRDYEIRDGKVVTTSTVPGSPALVVCLPGGTQGTAKQAGRLGLPVVRMPLVHKPGAPRIVNAHHFAEPGKQDRRPPLPEPWVYVGRSVPWGGPSPLGNPYSVQEHGTRALECFAATRRSTRPLDPERPRWRQRPTETASATDVRQVLARLARRAGVRVRTRGVAHRRSRPWTT